MKSWRGLAGGLMGWHDWNTDGGKKLDAIQHQHVSDEACLRAVVEAFFLKEHDFPHDYPPSWRRLIHGLHKAGESHLAEKLKTYGEPLQGEWV